MNLGQVIGDETEETLTYYQCKINICFGFITNLAENLILLSINTFFPAVSFSFFFSVWSTYLLATKAQGRYTKDYRV